MSATSTELDRLAGKLASAGVAAFCPTTLSVPFPQLRETVRRLGAWIEKRKRPTPGRAHPLGIHLEGPYIHPHACGAHPPKAIRVLNFRELEQLWEDSLHHLKIITFAPEQLSEAQLKKLIHWCQVRTIHLSLGHSQATETQAKQAFDLGVRGLTHAWNALTFHHRAPGPLGAALGRKDVAIELILDQVHVAPTILRWTRTLHGQAPLCYVSDCAPAAGTRAGSWHLFGNLKIRFKNRACRTSGEALAGGGVPLPQAFAAWICAESTATQTSTRAILKGHIRHVTTDPLKALGLAAWIPRLQKSHSVHWRIHESPKKRLQITRFFD